jgi:integrase
LESFNNGALQDLVRVLVQKKLAPKTIAEVSAFVRAIVASVLDQDGNQVYPRNWNLDFVDAPPIAKQHQPTVSKEFLQSILSDKKLKVRNRVLIALLASTGTRIGELQALQIGPDPLDQSTVWDSGERLIRVRKSIFRGQLQEPKTPASVRDIDLPTSVNDMLQWFTASRRQHEFLFCTKSGKPLEQSYINRYVLKPLGIPGAHSLRRFRVSHLREVGCNEDILRQWIGHSAGSDVTNRYSKLSQNLELRRTWAERVETGLDLSCITGDPRPLTRSSRRTPKPAITSAPTESVQAATLAEPASSL